MFFRYSPAACLAFARSFYVAEDRDKLVLSPIFYTSNPQTVAAGAQRVINIPISNQADFVMCGVNVRSATSSADIFAQSTLLLVDNSSGEPLSQGPTMLASYVGNLTIHNTLPHPYFLRGNSAITANINNLSISDMDYLTVVLSGFQCRVLN